MPQNIPPEKELLTPKNKKHFDPDEFISNYRYSLSLLLFGLLLLGLGVLYAKGIFNQNEQVEIIESSTVTGGASQIVVEIAGAVEKAGVYKLPTESRVEELLIAAGGISADADRTWIDKMINRAAKLTDGQKIYIPKADEQLTDVTAKNSGDNKLYQGVAGVSTGGLININSSTQKELEDLPGIGPVYAQSIIEHRPYSSLEELTSKGALKQNVYEKIKDLVTAY